MLKMLWTNVSKWSWSEWGTILTFIGTVLSLWSVLAITALKRTFTARKRLPEIQHRLTDKLDNIQQFLSSVSAYDQHMPQYLVAVSEVRSVLISYSGHTLNKQVKERLKDVGALCGKVTNSTKHGEAFEIYSTLRGIEELLYNEIKDLDHAN